MIRCRDVVVEVAGKRLLDGVGFTVPEGGALTIIGPNGAGKSTLLRWLAGIMPGRGHLELAGRPAAGLRRRDRARTVAFVPQSPVIPPGSTVADYVLIGRSPHIPYLGVERTSDLEAVRAALVRLNLEHLADRDVGTLSGGERQRMLLARALAQGCPIVLLDEPTTALDVGHQQHVLELVDDLRRTEGLTVVAAMHDLALAGQYADDMLLIDAGRVAVAGSPAEVLTEANLARYYGARVRVTVEDGRPVVLPVRASATAPVVAGG